MKKSKILPIVIVILVVLSLNFFQKEVKNLFYFISSPIQKPLWGMGDRVSDFFETIAEFKTLKEGNEMLRLKNQELLTEIAFLKEFKKENETLREALGLELEKDFELALASLISKDISEDSILIDRGSREGILKGMPAITQEKVLLGKVSEVYESFSKIELISNKESSFDAKISEKEIYGLAKGRGRFGILLDLIPQDEEIQEGDFVVTTSFGGIFPQGLLVGQIQKVKKSDLEPFQQAEISPAFDIKELRNLFIITNYKL